MIFNLDLRVENLEKRLDKLENPRLQGQALKLFQENAVSRQELLDALHLPEVMQIVDRMDRQDLKELWVVILAGTVLVVMLVALIIWLGMTLAL